MEIEIKIKQLELIKEILIKLEEEQRKINRYIEKNTMEIADKRQELRMQIEDDEAYRRIKKEIDEIREKNRNKNIILEAYNKTIKEIKEII